VRFQEDNSIHNDKGALPGPFLSQYGRSAPAHQLTSWRCLGTFHPRVSPEALEESFRQFPESGLGVHCIPSPSGPVSSGGMTR
jgi:hypothetical protein